MTSDVAEPQADHPPTTVVWVLAVATSVATPPLLVALGAAPAVAVLASLVFPLGAVAGRVLDAVRERRVIVHAALGAGLREVRDVIALERLADRTHRHFVEVGRVLQRSLDGDGFDDEDRSTPEATPLRQALEGIEAFERTLRKNAARLVLARRRGTAPGIGGLVAEAREERDTFPLYGSLSNWPGWVDDRIRDRLARLGDVLDDVRRLHSRALEWSVLLLTLWARALLLVFAPWLAGLSAGWLPQFDPPRLAALPWALASVVALGTAAVAPGIATQVMRRDAAGVRVRRRLLLVEVPLCVAAILLTPCWPVVVFAVGWTNWAQRPELNWLRLVAWIGTVLVALAAGCAIRGLGAGDSFVEGAVAMAVIFIIGTSYGAMLPVSASVMARVVVGGLIAPLRGRRKAEAELDRTIDQLDRAADAIAAVPGRTEDAVQIRVVARALRTTTDRSARGFWGRPRELGAVLDVGLQRGGTRSESHRAAVEAAAADRVGESPPAVVTPAIFDPRALARMRMPTRRHADALGRFVIAVAGEARLYGTGPLRTRCRLAEEGRVVVRFVNELAREDRGHGRSSGAGRLEELAAAAGARIDFRGEADGSAAGLPARVRLFVVELSFPET